MLIEIGHTEEENIFILGAGASVDYSLPTWKGLTKLIEKKVIEDKSGKYNYKKEIMEWLSKIGDKKQYETIDECIRHESASSQYHDDGVDIENEIFAIMNDIFHELYKDNNDGWINKLNDIIKESNSGLENKISFINYNYDDVLNRNLFNFEPLTVKEKLLKEEAIRRISTRRIKSFHPHGHFEINYNSNVHNYKSTPKSNHQEKYIDTISCYDSNNHTVQTYGRLNKLYILGLGGGLKYNLSKLKFVNKISEIHITIRNKEVQDDIVNFLSKKFELEDNEIIVHDDCNSLITYCFDTIPF